MEYYEGELFLDLHLQNYNVIHIHHINYEMQIHLKNTFCSAQ
jgi:hypothetical protein